MVPIRPAACAAALGLLTASLLHAGGSGHAVEAVSFDLGISHQYIYCSYQDRQGFLWFGTMLGLVRHDGISPALYRHEPGDSLSLPNDDIVCITGDEGSNLWIGTFGGGLIRMDRATGAFRRVGGGRPDAASRAIVWDLHLDRRGDLWLGTASGGLVRCDTALESFEHFRRDSAAATGLPSNLVFAVEETPDGAIWAGTGAGLARFDPASRSLTRSPAPGADGAAAPSVRALLVDGDGALLAGTQGGGLLRFDPAADGAPASIPRAEGLGRAGDFVNTIARDDSGGIWVGTAGGLALLPRPGGPMERFVPGGSAGGSLPGDNIMTILPDRSGAVWVGAYLGGLAKVYPRPAFGPVTAARTPAGAVPIRNVKCILPSGGGALVGAAGGLFRYERAVGGAVPDDLSRLLDGPADRRAVTALLRDRRGRIWIGTRAGVLRVEPEGGRAARFTSTGPPGAALAGDAVTGMIEDRRGDVWVGTEAGLCRFEGGGDRVSILKHSPGDPAAIASDFILSVYEDRSGDLWVGTYGGTNRLGSDRRVTARYVIDPADTASISSNYTFAFHEDAAGDLWLGTGGGLNRYDPRTGRFGHVTERDGLLNAVVCGIEESPAGVFWVSTHLGLARYVPATGEVMTYDRRDGLQGNMFLTGASAQGPDGTLYFGGIDGLNAFHPDAIRRREYLPPVVITAIEGGDGAPGVPPVPGGTVRLPYPERSFTAEAAALDFVRSGKIRYAFRLEGYDEEWVRTGSRNRIRYAGLDPGEYRLRVIASNGDGVWNEAGATLAVVVVPPFWGTWWFQLAAVLAVAGAAAAGHRRWVRGRLRRAVEIERIRETERTIIRKRAADDFHDEFGHKLTKIALLGQVVKRNLAVSPAESAGALEKIVQTAAELSMGMRDFLWTLGPERDSAYDVAVRLKDFGDELFASAGIGFNVEGLSPSLSDLKLDVEWRRHLTLLFKEGMNNIVKHAAPSKVLLRVARTNGALDITLTDDGRGFDPAAARSGQGLPSMRRRAEKLRAELSFDTGTGGGTTIRFRGEVPGR